MTPRRVSARPLLFSTPAELRSLIGNGALEENHHTEVKRELASNAELARDLAAFAIDGGNIVVGVDEHKPTGRWTPAPQTLAGLAEKVEQIAHQAVDPPLEVVARPVYDDGVDATTGYLLIEIPPSPNAPHMVHGIYYGRGEKTKQRLSDAQVTRLIAARSDTHRQAVDLLGAELLRDPLGERVGTLGHLYLVAQPQQYQPELAVEMTRAADARRTLSELVLSAEQFVPAGIRSFGPTPAYLTSTQMGADGISLTSAVFQPGRSVPVIKEGPAGLRQVEQGLLSVEFREDGGLRFLSGCATNGHPASTDEPPKHIRDPYYLASCLRLLHWVSATSAVTGYRGSWLLGIAATTLRGGRSQIFAGDFEIDIRPMYDRDSYQETTTAMTDEIAAAPTVVAQRLLGRLLRALGSSGYFSEILKTPVA